MGDPESGCVLAIDQGGHASRALVFDGAGRQVAAASVPVTTYRDAAGHVEQNAEDIIASLRSAIDAACQECGGVRAAGLATQRSSIVCWHRRSGEALSPVISWQDRRNAAWLEGLRAHSAQNPCAHRPGTLAALRRQQDALVP